jgi:2-iminobutanoate/2-iminopropanoate deaminase
MKVVSTKKAPAAIGPYSQAIVANNMVFTSGQIALNPEGKIVCDDVKGQTEQILKNLSAVLEEAGSSLNQVVKTTIYLSDMEDFLAVNEVYASFFGEHKPARSTVAVKTLPLNVKVEIDCIALLDSIDF